jgi:hypothetical protein
MITTDYIHKFIDHTINKYIPEGIDPLFHINIRKEIKLLLLQLLKNEQIPLKLSYIKLVIIDYKKILSAKYSTLN